jgi:membrane fusion protein (multidrug efflux system)
VEEKDLHDISSGDPVEIHVDAWPALHLQGRVTTIIRATNSQFSLMPAEGVSGSFIKVTQRVPLRIDLERIPDEPLGPGLSVEIRIDTRGRSSGGALAERHD